MHSPTDSTSRFPTDDVRSLAALAALECDRFDARPRALTFRNGAVLDSISIEAVDPIPSMYRWSVASTITAVGFSAPATATPHDDGAPRSEGIVTHVVASNGESVTLLGNAEQGRWFGPTFEPQRGRVPDLCRRALGLPTEPPSEPMTDFVVRAWLEIVVRRALEHPELDWNEIVDLHPAARSLTRPTTPASLAAATHDLGDALDWERFRIVISTVGGAPFGDDAPALAAWMDTGMFSRWALDSVPTRCDSLDALESVLGPATFDRLWATICLSETRTAA